MIGMRIIGDGPRRRMRRGKKIKNDYCFLFAMLPFIG
jgi:hypothetical protein